MDSESIFYINLVGAIARAIILIIAALSGMLALWLGWKLYTKAVVSKVGGESTVSGLKLKLVAAGPGVFFVAFGMWVLVALISRPFEMASEKTSMCKCESPSASLGLEKLLTLVSTPASAAEPKKKNETPSSQNCILSKTTTKFIDGGESGDLSSATLSVAIDIAISDIRGAIVEQQSSASHAENEKRKQAVRTLAQAKLALNREGLK